MLIFQLQEVKTEKWLELFHSQYDPIILKALNPNRFQLVGSPGKAWKASGKHLAPLKEDTMYQVLQGVADWNFPVASSPENKSEETDAGFSTPPRVHNTHRKR